MSLNLKELVEGIRKINIEEIKESLLHSDSTKMINNMFKAMLEREKK